MPQPLSAFSASNSNLLNHTRLAFLEHQLIATTWNGSSSKSPLSFVVCVAPDALGFFARLAHTPTFNAAEQKNQFIEGLWEREVIELFLKDPTSNRYVELNFAPTGAWWCQEFSSPRVRAELFEPLVLEFSVLCNSNSWEVFVKLNYTALPFPASRELLPEINICAIFGETQRSFLALNSVPDIPADFHNLESYKTIAVV